MQTCWQTLGIEPIDDEKAIKKAYAKQLKNNRPDKNPDGFRQLRSAYEDALIARHWIDEEQDNEDYTAYEYTEVQTDIEEIEEVIEKTIEQDTATFKLNTDINTITVDDIDSNELSITNETTLTSTQSSIESKVAENDQRLEDWQNEWNACLITSTQTTDTDAYELAPIHDEQLCQVLQNQFAELGTLPLDLHGEFEYQLIWWFDEQSASYPQAFKLAKQYFNWDSLLEGWESEHYPWFIVAQINNRYTTATNFDNLTNFNRYLAKDYPNLYAYWHGRKSYKQANAYPNMTEVTAVAETDKSWFARTWQHLCHYGYFLRYFIAPYKAFWVSKELAHLDNEFDYLSYQQTEQQAKIEQWKNHPTLLLLRKWLFCWHVNFYIMYLLFLLIMASSQLLLVAMNVDDLSTYFNERLGIYFVIAGFLLFWQLQLKSIVGNPLVAAFKEQIAIVVCVIAGLDLLFYAQWLQEKNQLISDYIQTNQVDLVNNVRWQTVFESQTHYPEGLRTIHVFAIIASILGSLLIRDVVLSNLYRFWIVIFALVSWILPSFGLQVTEFKFAEYYSPLIWILFALPAGLSYALNSKTLAIRPHLLNFVDGCYRIFMSSISFAIIWLLWILLYYSGGVLSQIDMSITAVALLIAVATAGIITWRTIDFFGKD